MVDMSLSLIFDEETFSEPLEVPARVVWCTSLARNRHQVGLSFMGLNADQKRYLEMFLRYLEQGDTSRKKPPPAPDDPFGT